MFDNYFYAKEGDNFIIYEAKNVDKGVQMSLYKNEKMLDSKNGLLGEFILSGENVHLKIKNAALKSTHELTYNDSIVEIKKVKLKDLRKALSEANIYNEMNPTQAQIEAGKFDFKLLLIPVVLMAVGFAIQYFVKDMSRNHQLIPLLPEAIAGWMLYDVVSARIPWLNDLRKARIGFMALVVVGLGLLGEFIF